MTLLYSHEAKERIRHLPPEIKKGIKALLESLREDPSLGKALRRELASFWSIRYKRYRIIYQWLSEENRIQIYTIDRRERVYEDFSKRLRNQKIDGTF